jgi:hypothetical protein
VDPLEYDLTRTAELSAGKLCLWGGVNGHLTVERGFSDQIIQEVQKSLDILGKQPGFILSPVDNIREISPAIENNIQALITSWRPSN